MKLSVKLRQAAVKLPRAGDHTSPAFSTRCSLFVVILGAAAKTALQ